MFDFFESMYESIKSNLNKYTQACDFCVTKTSKGYELCISDWFISKVNSTIHPQLIYSADRRTVNVQDLNLSPFTRSKQN